MGVHRTVEQLPQRTTVWECENTVVLRGKGIGRGKQRVRGEPTGTGGTLAAGGRRSGSQIAGVQHARFRCPWQPHAPTGRRAAHMLKHPWHLTSYDGWRGTKA